MGGQVAQKEMAHGQMDANGQMLVLPLEKQGPIGPLSCLMRHHIGTAFQHILALVKVLDDLFPKHCDLKSHLTTTFSL